MGRKRNPKWRWAIRITASIALLALCAAGYLWWTIQHWTPSRLAYPDQGVLVGADAGAVSFRTLKALGAGFAYLQASAGEDNQDARFSGHYAAAKAAELQVGAVHGFDPCQLADRQSANFATTVPRDTAMLPPAIALIEVGDACAEPVSDAAVQSEVMTLINQIEMHTGRPVLLKLHARFAERYPFASRIERNLWVSRTRLPPHYARLPWMLWTANEAFANEGSEYPVAWVVMQP